MRSDFQVPSITSLTYFLYAGPQSTTLDARCAFGATALMSESQPKACLPAFSAVCSTADESVFCSSTSAPALIRLCAASDSFGGSNQVLTHTTLVCTFGFTLCAPRV